MGLAQLKKNGDFIIKKQYSLNYEKHNYIIKVEALNKLNKKSYM